MELKAKYIKRRRWHRRNFIKRGIKIYIRQKHTALHKTFLKDSGLLLKGVTDTIRNEVKEQKGGFLSMLLGKLGASLLGNLLTGRGAMGTSQGRGVNRAGRDRGINRAGEGVLRTGYGHKKGRKNNKMDF